MKSHHRTGSTAAPFADSGIVRSSRPPTEDARPQRAGGASLSLPVAARWPPGQPDAPPRLRHARSDSRVAKYVSTENLSSEPAFVSRSWLVANGAIEK